jgi:hypothetical protein
MDQVEASQRCRSYQRPHRHVQAERLPAFGDHLGGLEFLRGGGLGLGQDEQRPHRIAGRLRLRGHDRSYRRRQGDRQQPLLHESRPLVLSMAGIQHRQDRGFKPFN